MRIKSRAKYDRETEDDELDPPLHRADRCAKRFLQIRED